MANLTIPHFLSIEKNVLVILPSRENKCSELNWHWPFLIHTCSNFEFKINYYTGQWYKILKLTFNLQFPPF